MRGAKRGRIPVFNIINLTLLILFTIIMVYPFYQCVVISFNDGKDLDRNGMVYFYPRVPSVQSYIEAVSDSKFLLSARNTILRTIFGSLTALFVTSTYAYVILHKGVKLRRLYMAMGLITMYFSGGLIPTFLLVKNVGLYDNFLVYILLPAFSMFNALVFLAYFKGIPAELEECSIIDGANEVRYYFSILIPVAVPVFAAITLFVAVYHWNAWWDCMIYTDNENLEVLSFAFAKMVLAKTFLEKSMAEAMDKEAYAAVTGASSRTLQLATMAITTFPIIVLYPFLQKYFVKGIMMGSLKG